MVVLKKAAPLENPDVVLTLLIVPDGFTEIGRPGYIVQMIRIDRDIADQPSLRITEMLIKKGVNAFDIRVSIKDEFSAQLPVVTTISLAARQFHCLKCSGDSSVTAKRAGLLARSIR